MKLKDKLVNFVIGLTGGIPQGEGHHNPVKTVMPGMPQLLRQVAAEGAVLLENRVLPLKQGTKLSVFGRVQVNHFYTGYGSGGDVNMPYAVNLLEGLRNCEVLELNEELAGRYECFDRENPIDHGSWGTWPRHYAEMPLTEKDVAQARQNSDQAVILLSRSSGEDRENALAPGSYYLTEDEKKYTPAGNSPIPGCRTAFEHRLCDRPVISGRVQLWCGHDPVAGRHGKR